MSRSVTCVSEMTILRGRGAGDLGVTCGDDERGSGAAHAAYCPSPCPCSRSALRSPTLPPPTSAPTPRAHLEHLELCDAGGAVVAVREPLCTEVRRRDGRRSVADDAREAEAREVRREQAHELAALRRCEEARLCIHVEHDSRGVVLDELPREEGGTVSRPSGTVRMGAYPAARTLTAVSSENM